MNKIKKSQKHLDQEGNKNKIKMSDLSSYIFQVLQQGSHLPDEILMDKVIQRFGQIKSQTLKRRKYDVLNILEMADIIAVQKNETGEIRKYSMKHEVPNSVNDLERAKEEVDQKENSLKIKRQRLQMLKNTKQNLCKLLARNQKYPRAEEEKISLPFMVATNQFKACHQSKLGDAIELNFPTGTQFINNTFAHFSIFPEATV